MASKIVRSGPIPRAVLIPVSLRSLNTLGNNGFDRKKPGLGLWNIPTLGGELRVVPGAFARAWWSLEPALDRGNLLPRGNPNEGWPVPRLAPQALIPIRHHGPCQTGKDLRFQVIYGAGYRLDFKLLNALLQTGWHLRAAGAEVFYVVSPAPLEELGRYWAAPARPRWRPVTAPWSVSCGTADSGSLHLQEQDGFYESPGEHLDGPARGDFAGRLLRWISGSLKGAAPMLIPSFALTVFLCGMTWISVNPGPAAGIHSVGPSITPRRPATRAPSSPATG